MKKSNPAFQALVAFSISLVGLFTVAGCMKKKEPKELIKKEIADMVREAEERNKDKSHVARVVRHEKHERVGR